jgi:HTH-type transcriptional regulator/antitoxin HigA
MSQRDLSSRIDIAHSLLNSILKGNRAININIAIALESAGFKKADYWLTKQMEYNLHQAQKDKEIIKKKKTIKIWNEMNDIVPLSYLKKQHTGINSSEDVEKIFKIYGVNDLSGLKSKIEKFNPTYFRKSSKFSENKNNVIAWSLLAEFNLHDEKIERFSRNNEDQLIKELNVCFYKNDDVINKSKRILNKYGIKFLTLDRPSQTPVDGKSFMSNKNPAIALSLKYKRLDNFAFTLFHELGHVFEHLTNPDKPQYNDVEFFIDNNSTTEIVEYEADKYATEKLIDVDLFNDFMVMNDEYTDEIILDFSRKNKVHPGIVRGRVCYFHNEYYRKRSSITSLNRLKL